MSFSLNCRGRLHVFPKPVVMGILNVTPDSFFQKHPGDLIRYAGKMIAEGADIIDVGGQSTRPGATMLGEEEELARTIPAIVDLAREFPETIFSIDTFYSRVAREAIAAGASLINDVSAGSIDPNMFPTVAKLGVPYVLMHMKGLPPDMQKSPVYHHVVNDILHFLSEKLVELKKLGAKDIILDPGFGFGKTAGQNFSLLKNLSDFGMLGLPVLVGISRKKMIQNIVGSDAEGALNGTTAAHMIALMNGASILRVHDVKAAVETVGIYSQAYPWKDKITSQLTFA